LIYAKHSGLRPVFRASCHPKGILSIRWPNGILFLMIHHHLVNGVVFFLFHIHQNPSLAIE
jgi:hypothetical protein